MDEMTILNRALYTLNQVSVEGKKNLNYLLGSIQELERLKELLEKKEGVK